MTLSRRTWLPTTRSRVSSAVTSGRPGGSGSVASYAITMMTEGAAAPDAALIDVPVLVEAGERRHDPQPLGRSNCLPAQSLRNSEDPSQNYLSGPRPSQTVHERGTGRAAQVLLCRVRNVVERMAQIHNFTRTRHNLWRRLFFFANGVHWLMRESPTRAATHMGMLADKGAPCRILDHA